MTSIVPEDARKILDRSRRDPVWFVRNVLGGDPWSKSAEIMESVRDHRVTAVRSCHGIGKDWTAGRIALWFLYSFPPATVITTAPRAPQISIIWSEIRSAHAGAAVPLGGRVLEKGIKIGPKWFAEGLTSDEHRPDRFMGWHNDHVLVIADEASGLGEAIYDGMRAVMSSGKVVRRLEIGNPLRPDGPFYDSFRYGDANRIPVSCYDTPNFTAFGITEQDIILRTWQSKITGPLPRPYLVTPEYVDDVLHTRCHGNVEHVEYVTRCLGNFPKEGEGSLFHLDWIEAAKERTIEPGKDDLGLMGIDIARTGTNESVIYVANGGRARHRSSFNGETIQTAGWSQGHIEEVSPDKPAGIDPVGVGAGVYDLLRSRGIQVRAILGGGAVVGSKKNKERFANFRAQGYWHLREKFERGEIDIDPADRKLAEQLLSISYDYNEKGQIRIESKEKMAAEGKPSPDRADALMYTYASEILPTYSMR